MSDNARSLGGALLDGAKARAPYAAAGALLGGGLAYGDAKRSPEPLRAKVDALTAVPDRTLGQAMNLGQLQMRLAYGDYAHRHPGAATAAGALAGAGVLGGAGPAIGEAAVAYKSHFGAMKDALSGFGRTP